MASIQKYIKKCENCRSSFSSFPSQGYKNCSWLCAKKSISRTLTGIKHAPERTEKARLSLIKKKGGNSWYFALHNWIRKYFGRPKECYNCGKKGEKNKGVWSIHWANKDGKYTKNREDWIPLCAKCHRDHDTKVY